MKPDDKPEAALGAFTVIELLAIVVVIGLVLCLLPLPRRHYGKGHYCPNNLKQIGIAFQTWALDHNDQWPMHVLTNQGGTKELIGAANAFVHFLVMSNELNTPKVLLCPTDSARSEAVSFQTNFDNSKISYFVGVDALNAKASMVLSGDRNLAVGRTATPGFLLVSKDTPVHWTSALHNREGCLLFTDGNVRSVDNRNVSGTLQGLTGTNRLVLP